MATKDALLHDATAMAAVGPVPDAMRLRPAIAAVVTAIVIVIAPAASATPANWMIWNWTMSPMTKHPMAAARAHAKPPS